MENLPVLQNGSQIAVVGGGPTGSFFSIFALKIATVLEKNIHVTVYEPKDFTKDGPVGCNKCGGIISELLVQNLAVEGINLPDSLVQRGINSYRLHTQYGNVYIETPSRENAWRNAIPFEIVQIFEKHGFIWGGRWYHFDTMHSEYRPELFVK